MPPWCCARAMREEPGWPFGERCSPPAGRSWCTAIGWERSLRHYDPRAVARRTAWVGVAATALYLVAVALGRLHAGALLYDGEGPLPPYRWISPPPDLAADSHRPASGTGSIKLGALEAMPGDASTGDEQAAITFAEGAVAMRPGEPAVNVRLAPLDPRTVAPAPRGLRFDGNAYRITARYATSGRPAALVKPVTVVLRFPVHATVLLRAAPPLRVGSACGRRDLPQASRLRPTPIGSASSWQRPRRASRRRGGGRGQ